MIGRMRTRMGRLGVVMTFFALLFAMTPSLEAMACAAEGCDPACAERVVEASQASDLADGPASDDCGDSQCLCITGHCSHSAVAVPDVAAAFTPVVHATTAPIATEDAVAKPSATPERPPRI
jgi:hypothetical protein